MVTHDGFQPDRPPIFLSGYPDEIEQPDVRKGWDIATVSSRILKASILAAVVTAIGIAALSMGNPVALVANMTEWWVDKPALQPEADPPASPVQLAADTQDSPPAMTEAPTRDEITAAVKPADQSQAETTGQNQVESSQGQAGQLVTAELFKQFQAWAAEEETRAQSAPAQQAAPARVVQDAPAQARPAKRHRRVHSVQNARAEIRPQRYHRARVRQEQEAQAQVPPVADPRAPDPTMQNAQPPSFLQSLGFRNQ